MTEERETQTRVHRGRLLSYRDVRLRHDSDTPSAGVGGNPNVVMGVGTVGAIGEGPVDENTDVEFGDGPPVVDPEEPINEGPQEGDKYVDRETGDEYIYEDGEWALQGPILLPGTVPPGDGVAPEVPTAFVVTSAYFSHDDGTNEPVLMVMWDDSISADAIGYELQWDRGDMGQIPDPDWDGITPPEQPLIDDPIAPDWTSYLSARFGVADPGPANNAVASPVVGGNWYGVRLRTYDIDGLHSPWVYVTGVVVQASPDFDAPDIPDNVIAIGGYQLIGATWNHVTAADLSFYEYRYQPTPIDPDGWQGPFKAKSNRVVIDGLLDVTEYEVQVRAIDRSGNVTDGVGVFNFADSPEVGWSVPSDPVTHIATTALVGVDSIAFDTVIAEFIRTGVIAADQVRGGNMFVGLDGGKDAVFRIYAGNTPIGAWGEFGWIVVDPNNHKHAIYSGRPGTVDLFGTFFTADYDWDGLEVRVDEPEFLDPPTNEVPNLDYRKVTVTNGIESGIGTTEWTTAIGPFGINAEAITFGSQFGGNNRLLNAGFELQDFDTASLVEKEYTDNSDWGSPTGNINTDVSGTELRMSAV